jgi:hypothetical protein
VACGSGFIQVSEKGEVSPSPEKVDRNWHMLVICDRGQNP